MHGSFSPDGSRRRSPSLVDPLTSVALSPVDPPIDCHGKISLALPRGRVFLTLVVGVCGALYAAAGWFAYAALRSWWQTGGMG
jgi:hypothetical protein